MKGEKKSLIFIIKRKEEVLELKYLYDLIRNKDIAKCYKENDVYNDYGISGLIHFAYIPYEEKIKLLEEAYKNYNYEYTLQTLKYKKELKDYVTKDLPDRVYILYHFDDPINYKNINMGKLCNIPLREIRPIYFKNFSAAIQYANYDILDLYKKEDYRPYIYIEMIELSKDKQNDIDNDFFDPYIIILDDFGKDYLQIRSIEPNSYFEEKNDYYNESYITQEEYMQTWPYSNTDKLKFKTPYMKNSIDVLVYQDTTNDFSLRMFNYDEAINKSPEELDKLNYVYCSDERFRFFEILGYDSLSVYDWIQKG